MSNNLTTVDFLNLILRMKDAAVVREALEAQPELVHCREPRYRGHGCTPLHHATVKGDETVVRVLLSHGADVNAQEKKCDETALHLAACHRHERVACVLLEYGAEVDVRDEHGRSALHAAAFSGGVEMAKLLLEHGADVEAQGIDGRTPLHRAAYYGKEEAVRVLLECGADVDAQADYGWTPLQLASCCGHEKIAQLLLEHGADRSLKSDQGETARDVAERRGKYEVVAVLDSYFPIKLLVVQVLLGLRGSTESPLARFARHSTFEPRVLSLVKCLLSGEPSPAFEQLQHEAHR